MHYETRTMWMIFVQFNFLIYFDKAFRWYWFVRWVVIRFLADVMADVSGTAIRPESTTWSSASSLKERRKLLFARMHCQLDNVKWPDRCNRESEDNVFRLIIFLIQMCCHSRHKAPLEKLTNNSDETWPARAEPVTCYQIWYTRFSVENFYLKLQKTAMEK